MKAMRTDGLKACDVLLYYQSSPHRKVIKLFDGSEYTHAGIFDGVEVVEAKGRAASQPVLRT